MQIFYSHTTPDFCPCVATMGFFDGLHAGHRFLISELKSYAESYQLPSVVITFAVHPRNVLNAQYKPELLNTIPEKLHLLESTGVNACVVLDFNPQMAALSAYKFIKQYLHEQMHVRALLVGHDHRFGHNRSEGFPAYKQYGNELNMDVIEAKRYKTSNDHHISSSEIRLSLQHGNIEQANRLLTYQYALTGTVIHGFKIGRKIGFPTANIQPSDAYKLIPAKGVYAVWVKWKKNTYRGMLNIGEKPTLSDGTKRSIEVHILNFNEDIYDQSIEIHFVKKIRDERKFSHSDELIAQLELDKLQIISLLQ